MIDWVKRVLLGLNWKESRLTLPSRSHAVAGDIGLSLEYPSELTNTDGRIIYALWRDGEQCFCNLRLISGIASNDLRKSLRQLVETGRVQRINTIIPSPEESAALDGDEVSVLSRFRLAA